MSGLAGPEFTAKRGQPMTREELLAEEEEEERRSAPTPPKAAAGPHEPVAAEFSAASHGGPNVAFLSSPMVRKVLVGVVALALAIGVFAMLMPKGEKGQPLSLKFHPGQTARYRMYLTLNGTRTPPKGKPRSLSVQMGATIDTKVASTDASGATLDVTVSNFALHTGTPSQDHVPTVLHEQIKVANDGSIQSGTVGISAALASRVMPGWDLLFPALPTGSVTPSTSWSSSEQLPVAGDVKVPVRSTSTLLSDLQASGEQVAVMTAKVTIPVDTTIPMATVADALGVPIDAFGFPIGSDPKFAYQGQTTLEMTSHVDTRTGQVTSMYSRGQTGYTTSVTDWPRTMGEPPQGSIQTSATFSVRLRLQPPGAAASPEKSGAGGGASPG